MNEISTTAIKLTEDNIQNYDFYLFIREGDADGPPHYEISDRHEWAYASWNTSEESKQDCLQAAESRLADSEEHLAFRHALFEIREVMTKGDEPNLVLLRINAILNRFEQFSYPVESK